MSSYWEDPEGTRCEKKAWVTTRIGAALGFIGSLYYVVLNPQPSILHSVQKTAAVTLTMATVGAVFGVATCTAAKLRDDRDDPFNYFIGGCAAGTVFGARAHNAPIGAGSCVCLGVAAVFAKLGQKEGWRWM